MSKMTDVGVIPCNERALSYYKSSLTMYSVMSWGLVIHFVPHFPRRLYSHTSNASLVHDGSPAIAPQCITGTCKLYAYI